MVNNYNYSIIEIWNLIHVMHDHFWTELNAIAIVFLYKYIIWSLKVITDQHQTWKDQEATKHLRPHNVQLRILFHYRKGILSLNYSRQLKTMERNINEPCLKAKALITCLKLQIRREISIEDPQFKGTKIISEHYKQTHLRCHKAKLWT